MSPISSPAVNQQASSFSSLIPAGLLLALLTLFLKRRRQLSPTPTDPEARGVPAWHERRNGLPSEKVSHCTSDIPSAIKEELPTNETPVKVPHTRKRFRSHQKGRNPIAMRMRHPAKKNKEMHDRLHFEHMRDTLTCWGSSWLGGAPAASHEIPATGAYHPSPPSSGWQPDVPSGNPEIQSQPFFAQLSSWNAPVPDSHFSSDISTAAHPYLNQFDWTTQPAMQQVNNRDLLQVLVPPAFSPSPDAVAVSEFPASVWPVSVQHRDEVHQFMPAATFTASSPSMLSINSLLEQLALHDPRDVSGIPASARPGSIQHPDEVDQFMPAARYSTFPTASQISFVYCAGRSFYPSPGGLALTSGDILGAAPSPTSSWSSPVGLSINCPTSDWVTSMH